MNVCILGATGSIGTSALKALQNQGDRFNLYAVTARNRLDDLKKIIRSHHPERVAILDATAARMLAEDPVARGIDVRTGVEGLCALAADPKTDIVLAAIVGTGGVPPTYAAVEAGKRIALANKECLVAAGELFMKRAAETGSEILPVDSEHSAIAQCLEGRSKETVSRIIITASGGALRDLPLEKMAEVSPDVALNHPTWAMGPKITVDSATMMNKGFEVIEARWLFDVDYDRIEVAIHPESAIHSMVEFTDGTIIAQLAPADMQIPILHALSHPERPNSGIPRLDFQQLGRLTFRPLEAARYPCLKLAYEAGREAGTAPTVLNAANEWAVYAFLDGNIGFLDIYRVAARALEKHESEPVRSIDQILALDKEIKAKCPEYAGKPT